MKLVTIACASLLAVACASPEEQSLPQTEGTSRAWPLATKADRESLEKVNAVRVSNDGLRAIIRLRHAWHVRCDLTNCNDVCVLFGNGEDETGENLVGAWGDLSAAKAFCATLDKVTASGEFVMQFNESNESLPVWVIARRAAEGGKHESPIAWRAVPAAEGFLAAYEFDFEPKSGLERPQITLHLRDILLVDIRM
jgi:hypothetical protein